MNAPVRIEKVTGLTRLEQIRQLEAIVWQMPSTPTILTFTTGRNGGLTLGAFIGEEAVGFCYGFPGFRDGRVYFCSHMLGIHPDYRHRGIGEQLKFAQAEHASEMGYALITWTYDPLETVNARLNLGKLRAIGARYSENHYGDMRDGLNDGLPTDRFILEWWLASPHVDGAPLALGDPSEDDQRSAFRTKRDAHGFPMPTGSPGVLFRNREQGPLLVPAPLDFQAIKKADITLASTWRQATRTAITTLLGEGRVAVHLSVDRAKGLGYYIFLPRDELKLE